MLKLISASCTDQRAWVMVVLANSAGPIVRTFGRRVKAFLMGRAQPRTDAATTTCDTAPRGRKHVDTTSPQPVAMGAPSVHVARLPAIAALLLSA